MRLFVVLLRCSVPGRTDIVGNFPPQFGRILRVGETSLLGLVAVSVASGKRRNGWR